MSYDSDLKLCCRSKTINGTRYYRGRVKVQCKGNLHYFVVCDVERLTKTDALGDAKILATELSANAVY